MDEGPYTDAMATLTMNDGFQIPMMGYGTWRLDDAAVQVLVPRAVEVGYRHIDTAAVYGNETGVGQGIKAAGVPRTDLFITTKLWNSDHADPRAALTASLRRLGLEYVDLYLIHWPVPTKGLYVAAWEQLVALREAGLARSVGVSNFLPGHLEAVVATGVTPAVNQIERHPTYANGAGVAANATYGVVTQCYSPLGRTRDLADPAIAAIAARAGATPAQVMLAWHLARGFVVIPKTADPARLAENWAAQDLHLSPDALAALDGLDTGVRLGSDPAAFVGY